MNEIVVDYQDADPDGVRRVGEAIDGTGFFPGGDGLWRGDEPHGAMPEWFPKNPVMFVGHNFDKVSGYERSLARGIEVINGPTWRKLREYVFHAGLVPGECFFTNALMGLQPIHSRGPLRTTARFRTECREFLRHQIAIVQPRAIIALGPVAAADLEGLEAPIPMLDLMHTYASIRRSEISQIEGARLRAFLQKASA